MSHLRNLPAITDATAPIWIAMIRCHVIKTELMCTTRRNPTADQLRSQQTKCNLHSNKGSPDTEVFVGWPLYV